MRVVLLSWDGSGPLDGLTGKRVTAPAALRRLEALRAHRGFEPGLATMPFTAAALRRTGADVVHAFTLPDAVVAARSGLPAAFTFPFVPTRASVASRRGRLRLLEEALGSCRVVAPDRATADGLARWLGVTAPVVQDPDTVGALHAEIARR